MSLINILFGLFLASSIALTSLLDLAWPHPPGSVSPENTGSELKEAGILTEAWYSEVTGEGSLPGGLISSDSVFFAVRSGDAVLIRDLIRRGRISTSGIRMAGLRLIMPVRITERRSGIFSLHREQ